MSPQIPAGSGTSIRRISKGFTLIELLVVIAIIAILAAIMLPVLEMAKERAQRVSCINNLKQDAIAINIYSSDNGDYMPPLKYRDGNFADYVYQMFEYSPVNTAPPTYTEGPYNLGILWSQGLIGNGQTAYCPSLTLPNNDNTYAYYSQTQPWPTGRNSATATDSNPTWVRAGYSYCPSSKNDPLTTVDGFGREQDPVWPSYSSSIAPYNSWTVVPLFKQTDIDLTKSTVVDLVTGNIQGLSHKNRNYPAGLNAAFGDGHVSWQGISANPGIFTSSAANTLWNSMASGSGNAGPDFRYLMSEFLP